MDPFICIKLLDLDKNSLEDSTKKNIYLFSPII